jgi:hypothetical protein
MCPIRVNLDAYAYNVDDECKIQVPPAILEVSDLKLGEQASKVTEGWPPYILEEQSSRVSFSLSNLRFLSPALPLICPSINLVKA